MSCRIAAAVCLVSAALWAEKAAAPRHIFSGGPLTAASSAPPAAVADDYLRSLAPLYGLSQADLAGVYVAKQYRTAHNGVTHLVYRQRYQDVEVLNAEWTVNIDRDGRVINAGGSLYPAPAAGLRPAAFQSALRAVRSAAFAVQPRLGARFVPFPAAVDPATGGVRFHRGDFAADIDGQAVWYGAQGGLRPAWSFHVLDEDGVSYYEIIVDETSGAVLAKENLTLFQSGPRGLVFERESPQPNPSPGVRASGPLPLVTRSVQPFTGDAAASPRGWVSGTETAGNNVVAGADYRGLLFPAPRKTAAANLDFSFPLELGAGAPNPVNFTDASTVNLFYWGNRAHDLFYELGFEEAAGNFQQDNFGKGGAGGDPMLAYSLYAAAADTRVNLNNAFYRRRSNADGTESGIHMFLGTSTLTGVFTDSSYDALVVIHEYAHGVSTRLVRQLAGPQGGAMGEAWSDFFALEFLLPPGAPVDGIYAGGSEYFFQLFGTGLRTRPYTTNLEINPLTYRELGRVLSSGPEVHADGEIWVSALWEMRAALIRQHGEAEGRRRARLLVIDGMKLSPPSPTMIDMRDAILLADRTAFNGASQEQIWAAFARRGLGVLAQSGAFSSMHVVPSFERPSPTGSMKLYEDIFVIGETVRLALQDANLDAPTVTIQLTGSSGDLESLVLRRRGLIYTGSMASGFAPVGRQNGRLELIPGDYISAYYVDSDAGGTARLMEVTSYTRPPYSIRTQRGDYRFARETPLTALRTPALGPGSFAAASIRVDLPFAFPFFGSNRSFVNLHSFGLITFDVPSFPLCFDVSGLAGIHGVQPLGLFVVTGGTAQPNEGVYQSQSTPDSITFRWAAETVPLVAGAPPEPVNFAATLYSDGRIQLDYGGGNRNLASSPFGLAGCPNTPAIGLANGHEVFAQTVPSHHNRAGLENADTVLVEPPYNFSSLPVGRLETPEAGQIFRGVLAGRGVAFDRTTSISRVDVLVDGVARARATTGVARPDFCGSEQVPGCPNVGFTFSLNFATLGLDPGRHTVRLRATNARGAFVDFPEEAAAFEVLPAREPFGRLEEPAAGAEVSGTVMVRGWAAADDLRVTAVDILIDGLTYGRATYNLERPDICGDLPGRPNCPRIGFTLQLNTTAGVLLPNGRHTLAARIHDEAGRTTIIPSPALAINVNNPLNQLPAGALTTPRPGERLSGVVRIAGYAYDPDGVVRSVALLVDGVTRVGAVPYGSPRPEACARLAGVPACPNIGFELDYDTRFIPNGQHVLGIRITDDRGGAVTVPAQVRNGMNVLVEN